MTRQVMKLVSHGVYTVVRDDEKYNQFIVYKSFSDINGNKHKIKIADYADLKSCMYFLIEYIDQINTRG